MQKSSPTKRKDFSARILYASYYDDVVYRYGNHFTRIRATTYQKYLPIQISVSFASQSPIGAINKPSEYLTKSDYVNLLDQHHDPQHDHDHDHFGPNKIFHLKWHINAATKMADFSNLNLYLCDVDYKGNSIIIGFAMTDVQSQLLSDNLQSYLHASFIGHDVNHAGFSHTTASLLGHNNINVNVNTFNGQSYYIINELWLDINLNN